MEKSLQLSDAPTILKMVRGHDPNLTQKDAEAYALSLPREKQGMVSGCYTIKCVRPCKCPIGCSYNMSCGSGDESICVWYGLSTIPFGCFIYQYKTGHTYLNIKRDTMVVKVDEENETLACFAQNCGGPCCYCEKI
mmetsp:Transcript_10585/g.14934  ORF Transcript_10585/g.14934 Transcript_10585/m.14934 type:complete len:136 (-) Transcript_10585:254-661(-)